MTFFGIFKKIAGIWNMVLIKILSFLLDIENSKISSTFDVDIWNQNNPDFYVPPHPILYLLTFNVPYFIIIRFVLLFLAISKYLQLFLYHFSSYYYFLNSSILALPTWFFQKRSVTCFILDSWSHHWFLNLLLEFFLLEDWEIFG